MKSEIINDILDPNYDFDFENEDYDYSNDYIESICLNCGQTDIIPDFIYDECSRKKYPLKINKKGETLECGFCEKEYLIPSKYFKN